MGASRWYEDAFRADYRRVYPHRDLEAARPEARWLVEHGVRGRVLDLCCGFGRHSLLLAEQGCDVVGIDLSRDLLDAARELPGYERRLRGRLIRADARELPFAAASFDALVNLFSSFGYFGELDDARMLREMARVTRPGAALVLDLMNPDYVRANLRSESAHEGDEFLLRERRTLADAGRRVVKEVELRHSDEVSRWREEVRLYELSEMRARCDAVALAIEQVHGAFDAQPFRPSAPRMLITARRAGARP